MNRILPDIFLNTIIQADCVEGMKLLPDSCIDMVLCSPPYDDTRDYEGYHLDLHGVGVQVARVLKDGGVAIMVIQDQTKDFKKSLTSFRTILDWVDTTALNLFECCIYARDGRPGAWWNQRFRVDHEYMPIFFKGSRPQYFDKEHLKATLPYKWKATGTTRHTDGSLRYDMSENVGDTKSQGTVLFYVSSSREACSDKKIKLQHPATYPDQLALDMIQCFTKPGMVVLDPFMGSGTTAWAAQQLGRYYVGYDCCKAYVDLAHARLAKGHNLFGGTKKDADDSAGVREPEVASL